MGVNPAMSWCLEHSIRDETAVGDDDSQVGIGKLDSPQRVRFDNGEAQFVGDPGHRGRGHLSFSTERRVFSGYDCGNLVDGSERS